MALQILKNSDLATWIRHGSAPNGAFVVVDVRDYDYIGGHIKNSLHFPYDTFVSQIHELLDQTSSIPNVIFHCSLSQQRGPSAARKYFQIISERGSVDKTVYILKGGFTEWQAKYGEDTSLTSNFRKDIWRGF